MLKAIQFSSSLIVAFTYVKKNKSNWKTTANNFTCTVNKLHSIVNKHCTGFPVKRDRNMYSGETKIYFNWRFFILKFLSYFWPELICCHCHRVIRNKEVFAK